MTLNKVVGYLIFFPVFVLTTLWMYRRLGGEWDAAMFGRWLFLASLVLGVVVGSATVWLVSLAVLP